MSNPEAALQYNSSAEELPNLKAFIHRWIVEPAQRWYQSRIAVAELRGKIFAGIGLKRAAIMRVYGNRLRNHAYRVHTKFSDPPQ